MASVPPDANVEAYAHCCSVSQAQEHLTRTPRERLQTHGHIAVARAMEFNKDPLGVMGVLLEQPEIQVNQPEFGGEEGNTLLHLPVSMHDEDENEKNRKGSLLLILKRPDLDPNVGNGKGDTPLHSAARASSATCVDILLDDPRVNVAAVNYNKQIYLHVTCDASSKETSVNVRIARKIIDSATSKVKSIPQFLRKQDRFGNTGLHYAAARGLENVVDVFFEAESSGNKHELAVKRNHHGNLAIHLAAKNGHRGVVKRMLVLVADRHVDDFVVNIKDQDGFGLLHHSVRSGRKEILQLCFNYLPKPTRPNFDLYRELLAVARDMTIADFLLQRLNDEIVKNSEGKEDDYLANLLRFAMSEKREFIVKIIVEWHPRLAVVAMQEALETRNETIQAVLRDHPEVQREFVKLHKAYTYYVTAANATLVVSVLIITVTFGQMQNGGPTGIMKFPWLNFVPLSGLVFFQAMVATILAAFGSLPFSFAFFFQEAVDDTQVKRLLQRTRVLIVSASYFLMLSIVAVVVNFICLQYMDPDIGNKCAHVCEVALGVLFLCATLSLGFNFVHYWRTRTEGDQQGMMKMQEKLTITTER